MFYGNLQVTVTTGQALPLKDVKVTVADAQTLQTLTDKERSTDENGQTPLIELETVDKKYTFSKDNTEILPYKNYIVTVEKDGFIKGRLSGVQIYDSKSTFCQDPQITATITSLTISQPILKIFLTAVFITTKRAKRAEF